MSAGRRAVAMPVSGRTQRGKGATFVSEDHYLSKLRNLIDGLDQDSRKKLYKALGIEQANPPKDEVIHRLKRGQDDFSGLLKAIGAEKLPGCGSLVIVSTVGAAAEVAEADAPTLLASLNAETYFRTTRGGSYRNGEKRTGLRNQWPGLVRSLITFSPGDTMALQAAVFAGELVPAKFKEFLIQLAGEVRDTIRQATKLGHARAGIEPVLLVYHLIQGCLHVHVYSRDVDVTKSDRPRLGLFGASGKQEKPRLTLNCLGPSGVAVRRHREAGHQPPVAVFGFGLCQDWRILEASEAHRAKKQLGPCWDAVLADYVDRFWQRVLSGPLERFRRDGHAGWAKIYEDEQKQKLESVLKLARDVLGPQLDAAKKGEEDAKADLALIQKREKKLLSDQAIATLKRDVAAASACVRQLIHGLDLDPQVAVENGFLLDRATGKWMKQSWLALEGPLVPVAIGGEVAAVKAEYLKYCSADWKTPAAAASAKILRDAEALKELACMVGAVQHVRMVQRGEVSACPGLFAGMVAADRVPGGVVLTEIFSSTFARLSDLLAATLGEKAQELVNEANIAAIIAGYTCRDFEGAESAIRKAFQSGSLTPSEKLLVSDTSGRAVPGTELVEAARLSLRDHELRVDADVAGRASAAASFLSAMEAARAGLAPASELGIMLTCEARPGVAPPGAQLAR